MLTFVLRTIIVYAVLLLVLRLTGKRQIGELQLSELITALLLSELASAPIGNPRIPLLHAIVPIVTLVVLEVMISFFVTKSAKLKQVFDGSPAILVRWGVIDQEKLGKVRISVEELLGQMRLKGFAHLSDIAYGILEHNGQISFLPTKSASPPSADDLAQTFPEDGIDHPVVVDGVINPRALAAVGKNEAWLYAQIHRQKLHLADVFLCTVCDDGSCRFLVKKEG